MGSLTDHIDDIIKEYGSYKKYLDSTGKNKKKDLSSEQQSHNSAIDNCIRHLRSGLFISIENYESQIKSLKRLKYNEK